MAAAFKEMDAVTECSICTEVFTDPRVLPCVHTYCFKCIVGWGKDKKPGDKLSCPLCRKEYVIPEEGLEGLQRNFFVEKMIRVGELTSVGSQSTSCDMCTYRAESGATPIKSATSYCHQCQENYCEPCASIHRKQKLSRDHRLLQITDKVKAEELLAQYPPASCDKHADETLKIYCNDCKLVACVICYIKDHNAHRCSEISDVIDELGKKMTDDVNGIGHRVEWCKDTLKSLLVEKQTFSEQIRQSEQKIREKTKQLKQMIDRHEESLLTQLRSLERKRRKDMDTTYENVEHQLAAMDSYVKYVNEMREKGSPCDIARAASGLHDRADELLMFDVTERTLDALGHADVTFKSSTLVSDDFTKTVGQLQITNIKIGGIRFSPVRLVHVLPGEREVLDVASLCDQLFVVRGNKKEVEVYDIETFSLQRAVAVPQLSVSASGIAACAVNRCLYLSDWDIPSIHRVDVTSDAVKKWAVAKEPRGLSMTSDHNVLVACSTENKLQEFTTDGRLVREMCLQGDSKSPWQAVQLSARHYAVTQDISPGVVNAVGVDGRVVHSYGKSPASDVGPMKRPRSLAVVKQDDVLVADRGNNRILAINSSFTRAQELPLPADLQLTAPRALYLDESRDRLYVGENGGNCRVIVLDNVRRIDW